MRRGTARKRILAAALLVSFLAAACLSMTYAVTHARHRCTGDGCVICERLEACLQTLRRTGLAVPGAGVSSAGALPRPEAAILPGSAVFLSPASLLTLKIRLNN